MIREAEQFAEQDKFRKEEADVRNNADSLLYAVEKTKNDLGDKISKENLEHLDKVSSELRQKLLEKDVKLIRAKMEELNKVLQDIGTAAYQRVSEQQQRQRTPADQQSTEGGKVVDADYRVVS